MLKQTLTFAYILIICCNIHGQHLETVDLPDFDSNKFSRYHTLVFDSNIYKFSGNQIQVYNQSSFNATTINLLINDPIIDSLSVIDMIQNQAQDQFLLTKAHTGLNQGHLLLIKIVNAEAVWIKRLPIEDLDFNNTSRKGILKILSDQTIFLSAFGLNGTNQIETMIMAKIDPNGNFIWKKAVQRNRVNGNAVGYDFFYKNNVIEVDDLLILAIELEYILTIDKLSGDLLNTYKDPDFAIPWLSPITNGRDLCIASLAQNTLRFYKINGTDFDHIKSLSLNPGINIGTDFYFKDDLLMYVNPEAFSSLNPEIGRLCEFGRLDFAAETITSYCISDVYTNLAYSPLDDHFILTDYISSSIGLMSDGPLNLLETCTEVVPTDDILTLTNEVTFDPFNMDFITSNLIIQLDTVRHGAILPVPSPDLRSYYFELRQDTVCSFSFSDIIEHDLDCITAKSFSILNADTIIPIDQSTTNLILPTQGWWQIEVEARVGRCQTFYTEMIYIGMPNSDLFSADTMYICTRDTLSLQNSSFEADSIIWSINQSVIARDVFSILVDNPGPYIAEVYFKNCSIRDSIQVLIRDGASSDLPTELSVCLEQEPLRLDYTVRNATSFNWRHSTTTTSPITINESGKYLLNLHNECGTTTDSILITENNCDKDIYIPNAFTPNTDGLNDLLQIHFESSKYSLSDYKIFNRWGDLIYSCQDNNLCSWDGYFRNQVQPMGVYIILIEVLDLTSNRILKFSDNVTLLR